MKKVNRIQIFNPHGKGRGKRKAESSAKRNPLSELIFMSNPAHKSKKKSHHINPFGGGKRKSKKRSTHIFSRGHHHKAARRNPARESREGMAGWAELGAGGLVGLFASNYLAEMFLAGSNTGIMGYGATGLIGLAITFAGSKFIGKKFAVGAGVGTLLAVAYRVYQDAANTPTGKVNAVAQAKALPAGNSDFAASGSGGMGTYTQVAFPFPSNYQYAGGPGSGLQYSPSMPSPGLVAIPAASNGPGNPPTNGALERDARY